MLKGSALDVRCVVAFAVPVMIGVAFMLGVADRDSAPTLPTREATERAWYDEYCNDAVDEAMRYLDDTERLTATTRNAPECWRARPVVVDWRNLCIGVAYRLRQAAQRILETDDRIEQAALDVLTTDGDVCADVPSTQALRERCFDDGNYECLANVAFRVSVAIERRY